MKTRLTKVLTLIAYLCATALTPFYFIDSNIDKEALAVFQLGGFFLTTLQYAICLPIAREMDEVAKGLHTEFNK